MNEKVTNTTTVIDLVDVENVETVESKDDWFGKCITYVLNIFGILINLYGFLFSLGLMGDSFKILGGKTAGELFQNITNPISGLMVGILATVLVQSSSTSTSVVVSMVGADIISVPTAIPIIMGSNIGTSVTNSIVSLGQLQDKDERERAFSGAVVHDFFNILCVLIFLPLECVSNFLYYWSEFLVKDIDGYEGGTFKSPLKIIVDPLIKLIIEVDKKKIKEISRNEVEAREVESLIKGGIMKDLGDELAGSLCLFISLLLMCIFLYGLVTFLKNTFENMSEKCLNYSFSISDTWWGGYLNILIGMLLTISVQSSSVTTSAITPLVGIGIISLEQMYPITLGANIGTTCTGILASLVSNKVTALQIAFCHLSFNVFGVIVVYPVKCLRDVPFDMAKFYGKIAKKYKWFPLVHIIGTFVLSPMILLGISMLFESNMIGMVFGVFLVSMIILIFAMFGYWYYCRDGKNQLLTSLESE